ncbi:MAG: ABC transporter permease [Candidatus Acidiferrales bacterium]
MRPAHWMYTLPLRLRSLFRRRRVDEELDDELHGHIEQKTQSYIASGLTPQDARRAALLDLGGIEKRKEECRDARRVHWLQDLLQDLRYAFRMLRKSPGFTVVAAFTLALGIGANTAIFSIVDTVLLRPLPFKNPSRLVMLWEGLPEIGYPKIEGSAPDIVLYQREQRSFDSIGAFQNKDFDISGGSDEPERITAARVSASTFPLLGISPLIGRTYTPAEDESRAKVVVLSYGLWQRRYAGDRGILGRTIDLDREPYTVLGVMPRNFVFPVRGPEGSDRPAEVWVPISFTPLELTSWGMYFNNNVLCRLKPGATIAQAQAEANLIAGRLMQAYPAALLKAFPNAHLRIQVTPFQGEVIGPVQTLLLVLMAAVALVLLIACANVATLLLSRAASRSKEIAIRTALGASRGRLVRQMLTESLVLALVGGVFGVLIALWGANALLSLVPSSIPLPQGVSVSGSMLAFVAAVCCVTAMVFGAAPAFQISASSPQGALQEGGRSGTPGRARRRLQGIFVTAEFALALVLLVGAGLLVRSFAKLLDTNPGFRPDRVLTMSVPLPSRAYSKAAQIRQFYQQALERISALPGVESDGVSNDLPLNGTITDAVHVEGSTGSTPATRVSWVLGDYFRTMGIPVLRGRAFTPEDRPGTQLVAVISEGAAKALWPGQDAIGKRFTGAGQRNLLTVVGIVGDVSDSTLDTKPLPHVYAPYLQVADAQMEDTIMNVARSMNIAVRTAGDPAALTSAVTEQIHALDPDLAIAQIRTMDQDMEVSVAGPKFNTFLLGIFSLAALFLAAIGIYGVLAYTVAQQTHEIGVRMALGAQPRHVLRLVLAHGARLALIGIVIGLLAAFGLTRLMASLLYGISASDPLTFAAVAVALFAVALLACYIPARRAMRVDPMVALRYE